MSLEFYMSASGHGKTYNLYRRLIDEAIASADSDRKFILIVPEQSSLQAQKDIVRMHENGGVFNIDVVTFGRLAYRIFEELGIELKETIDDTGKNLIVRKVLSKVSKQLRIIKADRTQGFVSEIKSMISELKQYGIGTEDLRRIIEEIKSTDRLKQKLSDILVIYEAFEEYIRNKYVTVEDKPEELLRVIGKSSFFNNAVVAFDGFTGFTPVQYRLFECILSAADHVINTVTIPDDVDYNVINGEADLFHMSKNMMQIMGRIADRLGHNVVYTRITPDRDKYRFAKSEELNFLENELFRYSGREYDKPVNDIKIIMPNTPGDEVQLAAAGILDCVRSKAVRYREIAVVAGDINEYGDYIQRVFTESGISFFMDTKRSLIGNPVVEYIRSALEIIKDNFSYESVFRFLKNGMCAIERDRVDILENYVLAMGVRGRNRWHDMFIRKYSGKNKDLQDINETREDFINIISEFEKALTEGDRTVAVIVRAIYELMEAANAYEHLEELAVLMEKDSRKADNMAKAAEYRQTYAKIIGLLDQLNSLLGDEVVTIEEFISILDAGFEEIKVGVIPPSVDCVTVGDIERTRLEHIKILFILGVNEGVLPKLSSNKGVLSENERRILGDNDVVLSPSPREKVFIQNFYLYLNMTEPENGLCLMCHKYDSSGKECKPSRIISMVQKMYPKLVTRNQDRIREFDKITNPKNSLHIASTAFINSDKVKPGIKEMLTYFLETEPYAGEIRHIMEMYVKETAKDTLSGKASDKLYSEIEKSSISRLEKYAKCAFMHFADYGLELEERKVYEINPADLGNIFHTAIENISIELRKRKMDFSMVSDEDRREMVINAVMDATADYNASFFTESGKNAYIKQRIINLIDHTVWALGKQLEAGQFKPVSFENVFFEQFSNTAVTGKIDRVDIFEKDDSIHVKIIDYKSGANDIDLDAVYNGLKLQLMVYLHSTVKKLQQKNPDKTVIAAGALYNRIDNPIISKTKEEDLEKILLDAMRPTGMVGYESIQYLDEWDSGKSLVVPARRNKDGKLYLDSHLLTDEQLKCLSDYAMNKMAEMEKEINSGAVSANPYPQSCEYCPYSNVCGFDSGRQEFRQEISIKDEPDKWLLLGYNGTELSEED